MEASCRNCLLCFPSVVYHLILWGHHMTKAQMRLVPFRYIPLLMDGCSLLSSSLQFLIWNWHWLYRFHQLGSLPLRIPQHCKYFLIIMQWIKHFQKRFVYVIFLWYEGPCLLKTYNLIHYFVNALSKTLLDYFSCILLLDFNNFMFHKKPLFCGEVIFLFILLYSLCPIILHGLNFPVKRVYSIFPWF